VSTIKPNLKDPDQIRLYNIVDMGLTFSAMIRLFESGHIYQKMGIEKFRCYQDVEISVSYM
jgi:hypothetical protein